VIRVVEGLVLPEVVTGDLVSRFVRGAVRLGTWIFHTLVETTLGMVYAIVRRVDAQLRLRGRSLGRRGEALLSVAILAVSIVTAQAGLVALVAAGYGTMAWVFFVVYFVPLITVGLIRLVRPNWMREFWARA
jgi:uncharacterized membrane protein YkvI